MPLSKATRRLCATRTCQQPIYSRGLCNKCYQVLNYRERKQRQAVEDLKRVPYRSTAEDDARRQALLDWFRDPEAER